MIHGVRQGPFLVAVAFAALASVAASCHAPLLAAAADHEAAIQPALAGLDERVALDLSDTPLDRVAGFLSEQSGYTVIADPRYRDLRVSLVGAEGTLAEVLSAVCLASGMEARRLDKFIVLSPDARGIAIAGREMRTRYAPQLAQDRGDLAARREAAVAQAQARLGMEDPAQALAQLQPWQLTTFQAQGYLAVAQLFPQYYVPLYDIFGNVINRGLERPPTLPEFAGTRVYLGPTLRMELHIPGAGGAAETVWPIDLIAPAER